MSKLRLGLNIDHVATVRNARGGGHPDPLEAALLAVRCGVDGITMHLREDRRHIRDEDVRRVRAEADAPLNLEMAATEEMVAIACALRPHAACIVPEKRTEVTTEGGLDAAGQLSSLRPMIARLRDAGVRVSLFVDPDASWNGCATRRR
jgi:pyridoxine 5-phosphate synthase